MSDILTLTGYLGKDREVCFTQEKTKLIRVKVEDPAGEPRHELSHLLPELYDEREITVGGREYIKLSLAVHGYRDGRKTTTWYQCIRWNTDGAEWFNVQFARKGYKVRITGRPYTYTFTDEAGRRQRIERIEILRFEILKRKPAPERP